MGVFNLIVFVVGVAMMVVGGLMDSLDTTEVGFWVFLAGFGILILRRIVRGILR